MTMTIREAFERGTDTFNAHDMDGFAAVVADDVAVVAPGVRCDGKAAFAFDFVEEPEDGDEVGEVEETRYFVAPEVAAPLADAILDAEPTAEGPQLTLKRQPQ